MKKILYAHTILMLLCGTVLLHAENAVDNFAQGLKIIAKEASDSELEEQKRKEEQEQKRKEEQEQKRKEEEEQRKLKEAERKRLEEKLRLEKEKEEKELKRKEEEEEEKRKLKEAERKRLEEKLRLEKEEEEKERKRKEKEKRKKLVEELRLEKEEEKEINKKLENSLLNALKNGDYSIIVSEFNKKKYQVNNLKNLDVKNKTDNNNLLLAKILMTIYFNNGTELENQFKSLALDLINVSCDL